ncbi:MAG: acetolactate decarboxylase [Lactovum sp.]
MVSKIFQHNSFYTLSQGFYKGTVFLEDVMKKGELGIGTLDGASGELIILDGKAYKADDQNKINLLNGKESLPYVAVWKASIYKKLTYKCLSSQEIFSNLMTHFPSKNFLYSLKIMGNFKKVEVTCKSDNNTKSYSEILKTQAHFIQENIEGTALGIYAPQHLEQLFGQAFHLHFLSRDKKFGAHLDHFISEEVTVELGIIHKIEQEFANQELDFQDFKFEEK